MGNEKKERVWDGWEVKRKGTGCHASIRQPPPPVAEAEKSDRIETDQRIWRVFS
jgi:hypothetical protein